MHCTGDVHQKLSSARWMVVVSGMGAHPPDGQHCSASIPSSACICSRSSGSTDPPGASGPIHTSTPPSHPPLCPSWPLQGGGVGGGLLWQGQLALQVAVPHCFGRHARIHVAVVGAAADGEGVLT